MKTTKKIKPVNRAKSAAKTGNMTKPSLFSNPTRIFRVFIIACAAVLVTTTIGYAGFSKYQERTLKSKAANYPKVIDKDGYSISVCKQMTMYGNLLRVIASKPANSQRQAAAYAWNSTSTISNSKGTQRNVWWGGTVQVFSIYAGDDSWYFTTEFMDGANVSLKSGYYTLFYTPNC